MKQKENNKINENKQLNEQKERILAAIESAGKSQYQLAKYLGLSTQSHVNYMLKPNTGAHLKHIKKIAEFCNVSEAYLLEGVDSLAKTMHLKNGKLVKSGRWSGEINVKGELIIETKDAFFIVRKEEPLKNEDFYLFVSKSGGLECHKRLINFNSMEWSTATGKVPEGRLLGRVIGYISKEIVK